MDIYLAHSKTDEHPEGHPLKEHLENVAQLAGCFAEDFNAKEAAQLCGLLHDIGKYSVAFQRRLDGVGAAVDHSTAGAIEAYNAKKIAEAFCIAGHHAGLPNMGSRFDGCDEATLCGRLKRKSEGRTENYDAFSKEISIPASPCKNSFINDKTSFAFMTRMIFSCLVDADWLDTEKYFYNGKVIHGGYDDLATLREYLDRKTAKWQKSTEEINRRRTKILNAAIDAACEPPGLFSMTVPTGGGKTVSSVAFALYHAIAHGLKRIIYVIPYCNIIEQTQAVFEEIFGAENIVAHYSAAEYENGEDRTDTDKRILSSENWDAPIILTTSVQFFESLYSNKPSRCRKLHNISKSVIIFDEAQMLPMPFIRPCVSAISQLTLNYGCSAVLCTATQPSLGRLFKEYAPDLTIRELCPNRDDMYNKFRRVTFKQDGRLTDEELAQKLNNENQVLCIVNTKAQAQRIYNLLEKNGAYHLSTLMTPYDRRKTLNEIKNRIKPKSGLPCRVVSTSLVEAGVDLDFPTVYRAVAGLDSIIQAGGRCNRNGEEDINNSIVHIFETDQRPPQMLEKNIDAAKRVLRDFEDIASPEAIHTYFDFLLYRLTDKASLDLKQIMNSSDHLDFAQINDDFKIIDTAEYTVYIPIAEGKTLTDRLLEYGPSKKLLRDLGQFAVGVYKNTFNALIRLGAAKKISPNAAVLTNTDLYNKETGLQTDIQSGQAIIY